MQQIKIKKNSLALESTTTFDYGRARLGIGFVQGILLYFLYLTSKTNMWPATNEFFFAQLLMICVFAPVILISSLGHLKKKQIWLWMLATITIVSLLAFYDIWRNFNVHVNEYSFGFNKDNSTQKNFLSGLLLTFTSIGFYIAHSLILASAIDGQRIAKYSTYFETAWKLLLQIKFSMLFVGVLWLVLWLGATLFMLVKLTFLKDLLLQSWFSIPVTAFAFSCAIHITDVRPAIIRGIRTLLLVLMSWILPIATLLIIGFLFGLLLTGLAPLWGTRRATSTLLSSAVVLIILINAAYQSGEITNNIAKVIRISTRIAALMLLPIVAIAIYALSLRVGEYGWTTDRIIVAACLLVVSCYALGYAWAACQQGNWLGPIANVNVANAFVILAVLLALFSPIADPARLSVNSQMARVNSGKVNPEKFDFDYLKFNGARYGVAALEQLQLWSQGNNADTVRKKANAALKKNNRWEIEKPSKLIKPIDIVANLTVWPKTAHLPTSFLNENWKDDQHKWTSPECLKEENQKCDAYLIDFNNDSKPEVLLISSEKLPQASLMMIGEDGHWNLISNLSHDLAKCTSLHKKLKEGDFKLVPSLGKDLEIAGQRIEIRKNNPTRITTNCGS